MVGYISRIIRHPSKHRSCHPQSLTLHAMAMEKMYRGRQRGCVAAGIQQLIIILMMLQEEHPYQNY